MKSMCNDKRRPILGCYMISYNTLLLQTLQEMRETVIENYLIEQWTKRTRGECIKLHPDWYRGIPDRMCQCWPGWTIYVETKAPTGSEAPAQKIVHKRWRARGHWVECLYTKEAVDKFIDTVCEYITKQTDTKTKG